MKDDNLVCWSLIVCVLVNFELKSFFFFFLPTGKESSSFISELYITENNDNTTKALDGMSCLRMMLT